MKIVLVHPQIPQNTGNVVRTCAVTGCGLILVRPLGFSVNDRWLKRAGLDYWEGVDVEIVDHLDDLKIPGNFHIFSSKATRSYTEVDYTNDDWLLFGSETTGIPAEFTTKYKEHLVKIPMLPQARCLNLATSVGIGVYEAQRQIGINHRDQ